MSLLEVFASIPVMVGAGVAAAVITWRWLEARNGRIEERDDEYGRIAKALGINPNEVFQMGAAWAASGATIEEVSAAAKRWNEAAVARAEAYRQERGEHGNDS